MGSPTITHDPHHAIAADAKSKSTLSEWLRNRRERRADRYQSDQLMEHINVRSQWVRDAVRADLQGAVKALTKQKSVAGSPTDLDGSRPAYLLRHLAMLALDKEIDPDITFQGAVEHLQSAWNMLLERAAQQAAFERHAPVNAAEAAADGALLFAAARRGNGSQRGQVVAAEIVDRALNAPTSTALQVALTEEVLERLDAGEPAASVEATAVMSPVRAADGDVQPALPVDECADPGDRSLPDRPLPKRHRVVSVPARMSAVPGVPADGSQWEASQLLVMPGAWMLTGGVWSLVESAAVDEHSKQVIAHPAGLDEVALASDAPVWLLAPEGVAPLVEAYRAELNELESAR